MSLLSRSLLALAAIGAAVLHLALVIGSPLPLGIALALLGAAQFAWGVLTLSRNRLILPRVARVVALAPAVLWGILAVLSTALEAPQVASYFNFFPMAVAALFELFIFAAIAVQSRAEVSAGDVSAGEAQSTRPVRAWRYPVGLAVGALIIAGLTTPALAYTQADASRSHASYNFGTMTGMGH